MEQTIGPFPEETEAYHKTWNIALFYPFAMTGATIIQFLTYLCYNRWLHPFKVLVENYQPEVELDPTTIELRPVQAKESEDSERSPKPEDSKIPEDTKISEEPEHPLLSGDIQDNAVDNFEIVVEPSEELVELLKNP